MQKKVVSKTQKQAFEMSAAASVVAMLISVVSMVAAQTFDALTEVEVELPEVTESNS